MKKIKLNGVEYEVCTSWGDVTLAHQIQVSIDSGKQESDILKKISILSGYSNIPLQVLKHSKIDELQDVFKHLSFINTDIPEKPIDKFDFMGHTYFVAQNLMEQEFQDYVSLQNILETNKTNTYMALPYIMAIMCKRLKPDGTMETLDDYNPDKRAEEFRGINIGIATGISVFFSRSINVLSITSQLYSNPKELIQMKMVEVNDTLNKSGGQGLLTRCVRGILRSYLKYIKRKSDKLFTSFQ